MNEYCYVVFDNYDSHCVEKTRDGSNEYSLYYRLSTLNTNLLFLTRQGMCVKNFSLQKVYHSSSCLPLYILPLILASYSHSAPNQLITSAPSAADRTPLYLILAARA